MIRRLPRLMCALVPVAAAFCLATGAAAADDPKVPPGTDPGGIAVAVVTAEGLDYTDADIASRLARDGEGEIIGFDFADDDRRPYGVAGPGTESARFILRTVKTARLVPIRATAGNKKSLGQAALFVTRSPARVILFTPSNGNVEDWDLFYRFAVRFNQALIVVPAGDGGKDLDTTPTYPAALGLPNVLVVTAADATGVLSSKANFGMKIVDVAATVSSPQGENISAASIEAATRLSARALELAEREPNLNGAGLKAKLLASAKATPAVSTRLGVLDLGGALPQ